jgi:hypothetical protein
MRARPREIFQLSEPEKGLVHNGWHGSEVHGVFGLCSVWWVIIGASPQTAAPNQHPCLCGGGGRGVPQNCQGGFTHAFIIKLLLRQPATEGVNLFCARGGQMRAWGITRDSKWLLHAWRQYTEARNLRQKLRLLAAFCLLRYDAMGEPGAARGSAQLRGIRETKLSSGGNKRHCRETVT